MNRIWTVVIAVLIVVLAIALGLYVMQQQAQPPKDALSMLNTYARYLSGSTGNLVAVQRSVRAAHPERYTPAMSKATYDNNGHFSTTYSLDGSVGQGSPKPTADSSKAQLPFPPDEFWCVRFSDGTVVASALHRTLYYADWVLHEFNDPAATTTTVGCKP